MTRPLTPEASAALVQACSALCLAYELGEQNGGSMKWEHVDEAWELAKAALKLAGMTP